MEKHLKDIDENKLNKIIKIKDDYNLGRISLEDAKDKIKEVATSLKAYEIAYAEQKLKEFEADECQKEDIQKMLEVFGDVMENIRPDLPENHPILAYYQENDELEKILLSIEDLIQYPIIINQWLEIYDKLKEYRIHLSRKQNQLYPMLERKGFDRPTTTMWTLDDFIRDEIKEVFELLDTNQEEFINRQTQLVADIRDLISKENIILYPTSLKLINEDEFLEMKIGDQEIGFAWINKPKVEKKAKKDNVSDFQKELQALLNKYSNIDSKEKLDVAMGELTLNQINLIYKHLPVDLSYVDENDQVCFYSDTKHRVFPRSKNVIGRKVQNCHPQKSVHIVEEIIEKFKSGQEDSAEFWINKPDVFIYIYYVAVRDEQGNYKGVLEMMQDCTHIRNLQGSQTLLNWGSGKQEVKKETQEVTKLEIKPNTKIKDILNKYPYVKEKLIAYNSDFKILNTPLARVMLAKAKVEDIAKRFNLPVNTVINLLKEFIEE